MMTIKWEWRGRRMTDYRPWPWLLFAKHLDGVKYWSWSFHWKGSSAFWLNFKRRHDSVTKYRFVHTKFTLRLGTYIVVFGGVNLEQYYRQVKVLEIKDGGMVTYKYVKAVEKEDIEHLSRDYPSDTWRN